MNEFGVTGVQHNMQNQHNMNVLVYVSEDLFDEMEEKLTNLFQKEFNLTVEGIHVKKPHGRTHPPH